MGNIGDIGGQSTPTTGDGRRLTYAQIADRLGISGDAARILVRRRGWRRIAPNHPRGLTVVAVPDEAMAHEDWRRVAPTVPDEPATTGDRPAGQAEQPATREHLMAGALAALGTAVMTLREQLERAEAGRTEERQRADALRDRLNTMQEQLSDAHAALQASASADARADRTEADRAEERRRADRAEAALAGERQRADVLRDRIDAMLAQIDELRAGQAMVDDLHARERAVAQYDVLAAQRRRRSCARPRPSGRRGAACAASWPRGVASDEPEPPGAPGTRHRACAVPGGDHHWQPARPGGERRRVPRPVPRGRLRPGQVAVLPDRDWADERGGGGADDDRGRDAEVTDRADMLAVRRHW